MDGELLTKVQQIVNGLKVPYVKSLHSFPGVPDTFRPWASDISPSALYNCSLTCRKKLNIKTPEVKWVSIKRWVSVTPKGITLPDGVYLSIKRKEEFVPIPSPHFQKTEFVLMMFPYGNVWSQQAPDVPITEDWMWSTVDGKLIFESLLMRDAANPLPDYFQLCHKFMTENPDQIGIHLKRKKKSEIGK